MNHYTMLACRSAQITPTITLTNYADGSDHVSDKTFLTNNFQYSIPNLYRLLTILSKPKNKYNFAYNGVENDLHSFSVDHTNDYSSLTQFVIGEHVFHVKQVLPNKLLAEKCTEREFNTQSGELYMLPLPLTNLTLQNNDIEFEVFGLYCRITSTGRFHVFKDRVQRGLSLDPSLQTSYANSDVSTTNQYCIVYGQNDFAIVGDQVNNQIRNFVYIRKEKSRVIVITSTTCGILENGRFDRYDYGNRDIITNITNLSLMTDIAQFAKLPVLLTGSNSQVIECPLVWCVQRIGSQTSLAFRLSGDYIVAPQSGTTINTPSIAFVIGENR